VNKEEVDDHLNLNELCFPEPDEDVTRVHSFKPFPLRIRLSGKYIAHWQEQ
jgi:hypothetical protein